MREKVRRLWRSRSSSREVNDKRIPRPTASKTKSSMAAIVSIKFLNFARTLRFLFAKKKGQSARFPARRSK